MFRKSPTMMRLGNFSGYLSFPFLFPVSPKSLKLLSIDIRQVLNFMYFADFKVSEFFPKKFELNMVHENFINHNSLSWHSICYSSYVFNFRPNFRHSLSSCNFTTKYWIFLSINPFLNWKFQDCNLRIEIKFSNHQTEKVLSNCTCAKNSTRIIFKNLRKLTQLFPL